MRFFTKSTCTLLAAFALSTALLPEAQARPFRVDQIPNGGVNACLNCHIYPGGPRNLFGQEIDDRHLDSIAGNVVWSAALASLDSDGDGFPNGKELQDPSGAWRIGQPNPGSAALVTNPGLQDAPKNVPALSATAALILFALLCWAGRSRLRA